MSDLAFIVVHKDSEEKVYVTTIGSSGQDGKDWRIASFLLNDFKEAFDSQDIFSHDKLINTSEKALICSVTDYFHPPISVLKKDVKKTDGEIDQIYQGPTPDADVYQISNVMCVLFPRRLRENKRETICRIETCVSNPVCGVTKDQLSEAKLLDGSELKGYQECQKYFFNVGSRMGIVFSDEEKKTIKWFHLFLDVPLALNCHDLSGFANKPGDAFDTRGRILLCGKNGNGNQSLWADDGAPFFNWARLLLTTKPFLQSGDSRVARAFENRSLLQITEIKQMQSKGTCPLLLHHEVELYERRFGFKKVKVNEIEKVALFFGIQASADSIPPAIKKQLDRTIPLGILNKNKIKQVRIIQEQFVEDINDKLTPSKDVRWLLSARFLDENATPFPKLQNALMQVNGLTHKIRQGLRWSKDGERLSFLPHFHISEDKPIKEGTVQVIGVIVDTNPHYRAAPYFHIPSSDSTPRLKRSFQFRFARSEPCFYEDMANWVTIAEPQLVPLEFPSFHLAETKPEVVPLLSVKLVQDEARTDLADDSAAAGLRICFTPIQESGFVGTSSIGSLGFSFVANPTQDATNPLISTIWIERLENDKPWVLPAGVRSEILLPVQNATPCGEDRTNLWASLLASDSTTSLDFSKPEADEPLVLSACAESEKPQSIMHIAARETVSRHFNHSLSISLNAVAMSEKSGQEKIAKSTVGVIEAKNANRFVGVIETAPFRVAMVEYSAIDQLGNSQSSEVAVWDDLGEGGRGWRIRSPKQTATVFYPPQVIGEAMEKPRPQPESPDFDDIQINKPTAARFGPVTRIQIDPTYADTEFIEAPWNLRRILGSPLQRHPGARVIDLRLELLYGLYTKLQTQNVWITELIGAIGLPPDLLDVESGSSDLNAHKHLVNAVLSAQKYRLAVEKLWQNRPDEDFRVTSDLTFHLRSFVEQPVDGQPQGLATKFRWPVPGDIPKDTGDIIDNTVLNQQFDIKKDSFPGGLPWAFDDENTLMSVYRNPVSNMGHLDRVFLSPLGGYGNQRAVFDNGRSAFETETTQGRVQRYRKERIGRIACLWHPAKHVVVYERTVVPSNQFRASQDAHLGRPILRKVEEYVEIMTPVRRYPEDGSSYTESGFLLGVEFKSMKIPVNCAWGKGIRREGWSVPLWNSYLSPEDAKLYPKPLIRFLLAGEGGKETPHEVAEPEKLWFYTSVLENEDGDTDKWAPVRDVDFSDSPLPTVTNASASDFDLTSDAEISSATESAPGHEAFSIGIVPAGDLVSLTHNRLSDGPLAALRTLTIARAKAVLGKTEQHLSLQQYAQDMGNTVSELGEKLNQCVFSLEQAVQNDEQFDSETIEVVKTTLEETSKEYRPIVERLNNTRKQLLTPASLLSNVVARVSDIMLAEFSYQESIVCRKINDIVSNASILGDDLDNLSGTFETAINALKEACDIRVAISELCKSGTIEEVRVRLESFKKKYEEATKAKLCNLSETIKTALDHVRNANKFDDEYWLRVFSELPLIGYPASSAIQKFADSLHNIVTINVNYFHSTTGDLVDHYIVSILGVVDLVRLPPSFIDLMNDVGIAPSLSDDLKTKIEIELDRVVTKSLVSRMEDVEQLKNQAKELAGNISAQRNYVKHLCRNVLRDAGIELTRIKATACQQIQNILPDLNQTDLWDLLPNPMGLISKLQDDLGSVPPNVKAIATKYKENVTQLVSGLKFETDRLREVVIQQLSEASNRAEGAFQRGSTVLRTLRAYGEPPKCAGLDFNRREVAYVFDQLKGYRVDMTPTVALVNRKIALVNQTINDALNSFSLRLPVSEIAKQLVPLKLSGLNIADLFPDVAGLKLKGLFKDLGFPNLNDSEAVKIRHGFDKAQKRPWLEADIDVKFDKSGTILSCGPVKVVLNRARFTAHARISQNGYGRQRQMKGMISGDWSFVTSGQMILTFRQTELQFDESGKIDFKIQPNKIELAKTLQFVTNLMAAFNQKSGVQILPLMKGNVPCGVAAALSMNLPPVQTGAFGISDLVLHALFGIKTDPFEIISELSLGSRMAPFTLNVWILNGGGYITQRLSYRPEGSLLTYMLEVGIVAGVGLGFQFGCISGAGWLQVGCSAAMSLSTGGGSTTNIRVFLLARGNVDVAGLIRIGISLLYEVSYDGNNMVASGILSVRVKISRFLKVSVNQVVRYAFAGGTNSAQNDDSYADHYC